MINKQVQAAEDAVAGIGDGATLMIGGFGQPGLPETLIAALVRAGIGNLTVINNNAAAGGRWVDHLFRSGAVTKVICSYPKIYGSTLFEDLYREGRIELELVPQGTLAERIRAGGAGIGGFFTRTAAGTELSAGKETRIIDGLEYILETPLRAEFALIRAYQGDRFGNLVYRKTGRNFGPLMATAADVTIAEVAEIVPGGALDAEHIITPGIFVDRLFEAPSRDAPDSLIGSLGAADGLGDSS